MTVVKTLVTDFTEKPLAHLAMASQRGFAVRMVDPGTYTLSSIEPWAYSEVDEPLFEDLTPVEAGDEVVVVMEDGDPAVQYFVRVEKTGHLSNLDIHYDRPNAGGVGPQGEQGEPGEPGAAGANGDAPQFVMSSAERGASEQYPTVVIDPTLQKPVVAGTYLVEAEVIFADTATILGLGSDVADTGSYEVVQAFKVEGAQLGHSGRLGFGTLTAFDGSSIAFTLTTGQKGICRMTGILVATGAGTVGVLQAGQSDGNAFQWRGSWLKVTKIA